MVQDKSFIGQIVLNFFTAIIFCYVEQKPPDMHWRNREKRNAQEHHKKASFFIQLSLKTFCYFVFSKKYSLHMFLMLFIHVEKRLNMRSQMFFTTGVLKNFAIFTGKHLCWSLFYQRYSKEIPTKVFSCKFCEIFKNMFFYRTPSVGPLNIQYRLNF